MNVAGALCYSLNALFSLILIAFFDSAVSNYSDDENSKPFPFFSTFCLMMIDTRNFLFDVDKHLLEKKEPNDSFQGIEQLRYILTGMRIFSANVLARASKFLVSQPF